MSVKLRLARVGKKKKPFYRIVAADSRRARDGRFIEVMASYSPIMDPEFSSMHEDRIFYWLDNGAVMTERVRSLLKREGVLERWEQTKRPEAEAEWSASEVSEEAAEEVPSVSEDVEDEPEKDASEEETPSKV